MTEPTEALFGYITPRSVIAGAAIGRLDIAPRSTQLYQNYLDAHSRISMKLPDPRRSLFGAAKKFLADQLPDDPLGLNTEDEPPRLTLKAITSIPIMSRSRDRILNNLDEMYREAFDRAKSAGDDKQMATLDFSYRREQLYFEILLDVRDAVERSRS